MGNRAVITLAKYDTMGNVIKEVDKEEIGVYLHWNGGYDSVSAFLKYCELKEYRCPQNDCYGWARLCQIIGNFFGGSSSLGIDKCGRLDCDNYDNGVYLIKDWKIVGRVYFKGKEQNCYPLLESLLEINRRQPVNEQMEESFIRKYYLIEGEEGNGI
jgi:hypothetical protein